MTKLICNCIFLKLWRKRSGSVEGDFESFAICYCCQVLIFTQWTKMLDMLDYYLSDKDLQVCRIDGCVKLNERKRQVCAIAFKCFCNLFRFAICFVQFVDFFFLPIDRFKSLMTECYCKTTG